MEFNKKEFNVFRNDIQKALKQVEEKHMVKIECGSITFTDLEFSMPLKGVKSGSIDAKKAIFEQQCSSYGFKSQDYKREFSANGREFQLIGFNHKAPKNNCILYCLNNKKEYKCNHEMVMRAFMAQENG